MPDISFFLPLMLQSAVIPFTVALALLAASRLLRRGAADAAIAIAAGFVAAYLSALHAQWSPIPKVGLDWLPWIAVAGAAGAVAVERIAGAGLRAAGRFALSLIVAAIVVWPAIAALGSQQAFAAIAVAGLLTGAAWNTMAHASVHRPTPPLLLAVVAGGAALALTLDSSQSIGQLSGALACVLAACVAFSLPRMRIAFSPAAAGTAVLLLGALLANAHIFADFPLVYIALLIGGLLADPVVAGLNRLRKRSGGAGSWATAAALTAIPTVVVIGLAVRAAADAGGY